MKIRVLGFDWRNVAMAVLLQVGVMLAISIVVLLLDIWQQRRFESPASPSPSPEQVRPLVHT